MNLNDKLNRLQQTLTGATGNPFIAGTHEHHLTVNVNPSGNGPERIEWVQNVATGERYEVTPEWRKLIDEYDAHPYAPTPTIRVNLNGPGTPTQHPDEGVQ